MLRNDRQVRAGYLAMMALSNAERQARYRAKLKGRASGDATPALVSKAVDEAVDALWTFFNRPGPGGEAWDDIEGCTGPADYRARLAGDPAGLVETCRSIDWLGEGLKGSEAKAIGRIVAIADVLELRSPTT